MALETGELDWVEEILSGIDSLPGFPKFDKMKLRPVTTFTPGQGTSQAAVPWWNILLQPSEQPTPILNGSMFSAVFVIGILAERYDEYMEQHAADAATTDRAKELAALIKKLIAEAYSDEPGPDALAEAMQKRAYKRKRDRGGSKRVRIFGYGR